MSDSPGSQSPELPRPPRLRAVAPGDPGAWRRLRPRGPVLRQLRALCRGAGRLLPDWSLIAPGDAVLAALSGGKDSYAMLEVLLELRHRAPVSFRLGAVVVHPGFVGFDAGAVARFASDRGVQTWIAEADIGEALDSLSWRRAPCALCSRLRRGVLYRIAATLGFGTLALGHHADDAIETALLNLLFNGQLRAMAPRYQPSVPGAPAVIRPLITAFEADVAAYAQARRFRRVDPACPLCTVPETERMAVKHLMIELAADYPRVRSSVLAALGNVSPEALMDSALLRRLTPHPAAPEPAPARPESTGRGDDPGSSAGR